jgi:7-carboxy-7-deazaguanine synthase
VLIRLSGCPLRCRYCDTPHAWEKGQEMTLDEILAQVDEHQIDLVEVTGGEPLAQPASRDLLRLLLDRGKRVLVETGGGVSIEGVDARARIILDIKTPGSGVQQQQDWSNLSRLRPQDELKFVICSRTDYEWSRQLVLRMGLAKAHQVHFSPVDVGAARTGSEMGEVSRQQLAEWILEDQLPVRLNLQLHTWIWGKGERGV